MQIKFSIYTIVGVCSFGLLTSACTSLQPGNSPTDVPITNASFESWRTTGNICPNKWDCVQHSGPVSYKFSADEETVVHGTRSLLIEKIGPEPWGMISQYVDPRLLRGKNIRLSAQIKREKVTGGGGLMLIAQGAGAGETAPLVTTYIAGSNTWHRAEIRTKLPRATNSLQIGAALEGSGKIWIDDFKLDILPDE